jgi:hypothetical protein
MCIYHLIIYLSEMITDACMHASCGSEAMKEASGQGKQAKVEWNWSWNQWMAEEEGAEERSKVAGVGGSKHRTRQIHLLPGHQNTR